MLSVVVFTQIASLICFVAPICIVMLFAFITLTRRRRTMRMLQTNNTHQSTSAACICGYSQRGLDTLRCPECGRVSGFDATPEQLGLNDEQLRRALQKRQARKSNEH
jgi:hypothetical protein